MNDKARQNIFSAFIVILLISSVFSSFYSFPINNVSAIGAPVVQTDNATGIMETNVTLRGTLVDDGNPGSGATIWFEYGTTESYGNDTRYNLSYNLVNSTTSTDTSKSPNLQFNSDYWIQNDTIAVDTSVTNFLNTTGLWDNISWVFRDYNDELTSWSETLPPVYITLHDITSEGIYYFYLKNDTVPFLLGWDTNMTRNSGFSLIRDHYVRPGTLYHYRACANNSVDTTYGTDAVFLSRPKSPQRFPGGGPWIHVNGTYSPSVLNLTWIKGLGANNTYIERNTASSWNRGSGTLVYNDTGTYYNDTGLIMDTLYYYQAWGYANWTEDAITYNQYSSDYASNSNTTQNVDPPYNGDSTYEFPNANFTWSRGDNSDQEIVVQNNNSYPTTYTNGSGNWVRQNSTNTWFINSSSSVAYFTVWSYNSTSLLYSVTGLDIPWGALIINCYDEDTNDSLEFDVSVSNQDGSQNYESSNNTNPHYLDINDLPVGDDIKITISASVNYSSKSESSSWGIDENQTITYIVLSQTADSKSSTNVTCINTGDDAHSYPPFTLDGDLITILPDNADNFTKVFVNYTHEEYSSRLYYRNIPVFGFDTLNAYLPPTEDKELYLLEVIDEADNIVSDAHIVVKRSVNGTFVIISRLLTDANGQADLDLISGRNYIFIISKDGYVTENASWTPGTSIFTHTFRITWEIIPPEYDKFGDIINFYGTLYVNNTMRVTFYDLDAATLNTHFLIYENYNGTLTYMGEYNGTTSNDITFWINVTNATRLHTIILYMNHSTLGEIIDYRIHVFPVHIDRDNGNWLENLIRSVVGDFDYGYVITFIWYLPCVLLIVGLAAVGHPGTGILGAGLYSVWITWYLFIPEEAKILTFASIAIATGIITIVLVKGKDVIH